MAMRHFGRDSLKSKNSVSGSVSVVTGGSGCIWWIGWRRRRRRIRPIARKLKRDGCEGQDEGPSVAMWEIDRGIS